MIDSKQKTILLVEDEVLIAMAQARALQSFGYQTLICHRGEEAVRLAVEKPEIDLILMDIGLGQGMDGTQAAREILQQRSLPIVFLTSHAGHDMVARVRGITRYGYVMKDSGDFVLLSSLEMAFDLFEAHQSAGKQETSLRESTEQALWNSEERYRLVAENAGVMIGEFDAAGCFLYANSVYQAVLGYSPQELLGRAAAEFMHPDDLAQAQESFGQLLADNQPRQDVWRFQCRDGEWRWFECNASLYHTAQSELRLVVISIDISERKRLEQTLWVNLSKYAVLFNAFPIAITVTDQNGTVLEANGEAERLLGISRKDHGRWRLDGQGWQIIGSDGAPLPVHQYADVRSLQEKRRIDNLEMGIVKAGSPVTWLNVTAAPLPVERYGAVVAYSDITEKKQVQAAMARLLSEKEVLLREVHHRVKNNMSTIAGLLAIQADTLPDLVAVHALQDASNRVKRMMTIYDRLYRVKDYQHIDLHVYLTELVLDIARTWVKPGQKIDLLPAIEPIEVALDLSFPIGIIINEWLTNAFKYAFPDGRNGIIRVDVHSIGEGSVCICVSDNGIGLPAGIDILAPESFGLGLVLMMAQQLEGRLTVERKNGSRFCLVFPAFQT